MVKQIMKVRENILYSVIFAIFFILGGYYIPLFYYQNLDTQQYIHITHPITQVENRMLVNPNEYAPCEKVKIFFTKKSEIDTSGYIDVGIFKIDRFEKSTNHDRRNISIDKKDRNIEYEVSLPCNVEDGNYFIRGSFSYTYKQANKNISFTSDNFKVTQK